MVLKAQNEKISWVICIAAGRKEENCLGNENGYRFYFEIILILSYEIL